MCIRDRYNPVFNGADPGADGDVMTALNPDSLEILPDALVEPALRVTDDTVQFERQGYFRADPDGTPERPVFNRTVGLRDSWVKAQEPPKPAPKPRSAR
jgi:glutaminyl-tRNA synthetase